MSKPREHRARRRLPRKHQHAPGAPPGSLTPTAGAHPSAVRVIAYGPTELQETDLDDVAEIARYRERHAVTWIDVTGVANTELISAIGEQLGLHALALEDVVHLHQRPKADDYDDNLYVVLRMPSLTDGRLDLEQVSLFVGHGFVVTFQEKPGDCLEPVRQRLRAKRPRLRGNGADYLAYALLDAIVDQFYPIIETYNDRIEELETRVLERPGAVSGGDVHDLRHDLLALRRALWPLTEALNTLIRSDDIEIISEQTALFLRDCHDHATQLVELTDSLRDLVGGLVDLQLSSLSHRMNDVMRVLTLIATVFIPLGFIAGVYGMNFDRDASGWNMPELGWELGYPLALGIMALTALLFLWYFHRKGWLGRGDDRDH